MSKESAKLRRYEKIALEFFLQKELLLFTAKSGKSVFKSVSYDGVYQDAKGNTVIVEVTLGGGEKKLKPGPQRKMLTVAFKLASAPHFLKNQSHVIIRRVLIVRSEGISKNISLGWNGAALKHHNIEIISATFSSVDEAAIKAILKMCIEEQVDDKQEL